MYVQIVLISLAFYDFYNLYAAAYLSTGEIRVPLLASLTKLSHLLIFVPMRSQVAMTFW